MDPRARRAHPVGGARGLHHRRARLERAGAPFGRLDAEAGPRSTSGHRGLQVPRAGLRLAPDPLLAGGRG